MTVTARGYVRAVPERARKSQVANPGERDAIAQVIDTTALAGVLFFTDRGRAYRATVHELPKERLTAAQNLFQFGDGEQVVAVLDARMHEEHPNLVFVTAKGGVKRTALSEFAEASGRQNGIVAMKLADDDRVVSVFPGWDDYELLLVTADGQGIRFAEDDVRPVGRSGGRHPRHPAQGRRRGGRRLRGRARGDRRHRDRAGFRQAHRGRRVPGAGARRFGSEGGEDRQGARPAGRGRARGRRGGRVPHRRRVRRWCRGVRCARPRATAAARR